ncbi:unnamed protein product [Danaus chrysippus]|uniref:(African queen) hypothetical protein n=1 Tax=Danaus chrysippus TaxID=151541 RepID=A0A8J2R901_9NEOP|nr:unnamed protein product [Danaus chrysippus]
MQAAGWRGRLTDAYIYMLDAFVCKLEQDGIRAASSRLIENIMRRDRIAIWQSYLLASDQLKILIKLY